MAASQRGRAADTRLSHVTFLLYSVGEDGEENGGDTSPAKPQQKVRRIWDGKDAVWPSPATPEEATKAFGRGSTKL